MPKASIMLKVNRFVATQMTTFSDIRFLNVFLGRSTMRAAKPVFSSETLIAHNYDTRFAWNEKIVLEVKTTLHVHKKGPLETPNGKTEPGRFWLGSALFLAVRIRCTLSLVSRQR